jgi:hypothetical protein
MRRNKRKDHAPTPKPKKKYGTKKEDLKKKTSAKKQVSQSIQRVHPSSKGQGRERKRAFISERKEAINSFMFNACSSQEVSPGDNRRALASSQ